MPRKSTQVEKTCRHCGTTFFTKRAWADERRYCSKACMKDYEREHGRKASRATPLEFSCKQCGKRFFMKPAYLAEYRKKFDRDPLYCSIPCSALGRRTDTEARSIFVCKQCGKTRPMKKYGKSRYARAQQFCDITCKAEWQRRKFHERFADGNHSRRIIRGGYTMIRVPTKAGEPRKEVLEHRWIMERHLGRPLTPEETVHHINGDRQHNTINNLELFSSRHGPGQRVVDKVDFAIEMLRLYPEFASAAGVMLVPYTETGSLSEEAWEAFKQQLHRLPPSR